MAPNLTLHSDFLLKSPTFCFYRNFWCWTLETFFRHKYPKNGLKWAKNAIFDRFMPSCRLGWKVAPNLTIHNSFLYKKPTFCFYTIFWVWALDPYFLMVLNSWDYCAVVRRSSLLLLGHPPIHRTVGVRHLEAGVTSIEIPIKLTRMRVDWPEFLSIFPGRTWCYFQSLDCSNKYQQKLFWGKQ